MVHTSSVSNYKSTLVLSSGDFNKAVFAIAGESICEDVRKSSAGMITLIRKGFHQWIRSKNPETIDVVANCSFGLFMLRY